MNDTLFEPSDAKLTFAVLAIDKASKELNTTPQDVYNRMQRLGLVHDILFDGYEMLHTQSADYVGDFVADAIRNHEAALK